VRFQVLIAASIKMRAFWDIVVCSLVGIDRRFRGAYCLHHHPNEPAHYLQKQGQLLLGGNYPQVKNHCPRWTNYTFK
jgi:hypothetical protein